LRAPAIPPGDLLVPLERLLTACWSLRSHLPWPTAPVLPRATARPARMESQLRSWGMAGALWLTLLAALIALLANG
jgi:hypothetical protein